MYIRLITMERVRVRKDSAPAVLTALSVDVGVGFALQEALLEHTGRLVVGDVLEGVAL